MNCHSNCNYGLGHWNNTKRHSWASDPMFPCVWGWACFWLLSHTDTQIDTDKQVEQSETSLCVLDWCQILYSGFCCIFIFIKARDYVENKTMDCGRWFVQLLVKMQVYLFWRFLRKSTVRYTFVVKNRSVKYSNQSTWVQADAEIIIRKKGKSHQVIQVIQVTVIHSFLFLSANTFKIIHVSFRTLLPR